MKKINQFIALVLAAGRGKRMQARTKNKTVVELAGRPMLAYTLEILKKAGFKKIAIVVGFAKESVMKTFKAEKILWVVQKKQLGTANAVKVALNKIPLKFKNILVIQGDDSAFYPPSLLKKLLSVHQTSQAAVTFMTTKLKEPGSLGRIIRDKQGKIEGIIEVKNATPKQKQIKEINTGCYCFKREFLEQYLPLIKKDPLSGEYYLPAIINLGLKAKEKIKNLLIKSEYFHGVNTPAEWQEADFLMRKRLKKKNAF